MRKVKAVFISAAIIGAGLIGSEAAYRLNVSPSYLMKASAKVLWDDTSRTAWPSQFQKVELDSGQNAYYSRSPSVGAPLVISLHTWSAGYDQYDPLAEQVAAMGWNYIHPHTQGANTHPSACLSEKVLSDVDEAITFAIADSNADENNVFIVGVSGGGYTALGYYLQADPRIKKIFSWVPISDLEHWHAQTSRTKMRYSQDILNCTGSTGEVLDKKAAAARSPLRWDVPDRDLPDLDIYAGINDGHEGSVPVSHSVLFYNKMVKHLFGESAETVGPAVMADILTRSVHNDIIETVDGRSIVYSTSQPGISLTIFEGGHEMLVDHSYQELRLTAGVSDFSLEGVASETE